MKENNKREKGSVTLEASLVLPIFIFLLLFCYGILMMFSGRQLISHAMLQSGQSLSLDSYANEKIGDVNWGSAKSAINSLYISIISNAAVNKEYFSSDEKWYKGDIKDEAKKRFLGYFSGGDENSANSLLKIVGIKNGLNGLDFSSSYIDENSDLHLVIKYEQEFLFDLNGKLTFPKEMEVMTHMWGL